MGIYWLALIMSLFLSWCLTSKNVKYGNGNYGKITYVRSWIVFSPLFVLALFRWNVGVDVVYGTGYYYIEYSAIQLGLGNVLGYETGFYWLMELCNALNFNLYFFYCTVTILFFVFLLEFLAENIDNMGLAIIIFFLSDLYLFIFSTLRQALGMAFFLWPMSKILSGDQYWKSKKWWIYTLLAIGMHNSIIYLLFVLMLSKVHLKRKTVFYITVLGCVLSPLISEVLTLALSRSYYFIKYFDTTEYKNEFTPTYFFIALLIFIPLYIFYDKFNQCKNNYILVNVASFVVILMLNSHVLVMPYRIFPLFVPVYILIIVKLVSCLSYAKGYRLLLKLYFIAPFMFLFINQYYIGGASKIFEYKSVFQFMDQVW